MLQMAEEEEAVTKLQSISRGRRSRRVAARTATVKKEREQAAMVLQNRQRGRLARTRMTAQREMSQASTSIGRVYRGRQCRRDMERKKAGGRALDRADMARGLRDLGRGAFDLRHVFLGFAASGRLLNDIRLLESYPNLQKVDLSKNLLSSLRSLERLPYLTELDASGNALTEVLDLTFPDNARAGADAWSTGAAHVGSQLRVADSVRINRRSTADPGYLRTPPSRSNRTRFP